MNMEVILTTLLLIAIVVLYIYAMKHKVEK
jgi:hypothetical protein